MAANYWIKLYIEILDDPKMATLPDRLWRRSVELFLCAGKFGSDGMLPETAQLAWLLRLNTDDLEMDLKQIATTGIIERVNGGWMVKKFAERQAPVSARDRQRYHRDRMKKQQYYEDVTTQSRNVTQINRLTDNRLTEEEAEAEAELPPPPPPFFNPVKVLSDASGLAAFPADQLEWVEVVHSLVEQYGQERTTQAMRAACQRWANTKNKNGAPYRKTNLSWINWAQEELAKSAPVFDENADVSEMTMEELQEYANWKYGQGR